ncbi:MAG: pyruvate, phosphate dikinase [Planctomycetota bacterium]|jgi:pyruvate,orthophosphate dikinase|nr:pyruvate, phosphate dikinase [Planctomycetota bacterium]MDP6764182.1 pyruvate, phosphate dikinase [Planctomycetota bacterium]
MTKSSAPRTPKSSKHGKAKSRRRSRAPGFVFSFGSGKTKGNREMRELLGGKGANLAEMCNLGLPVPPGFTISTEVCTHFSENAGAYPAGLVDDVEAALARVERELGRRFGDAENPLLLSVRSGARVSMPGMMDTVLNLGLNDKTVVGLARRSDNDRFAWDAYRRFIQMYGDVVMGVKAADEEGRDPFSEALDALKRRKRVEEDTELDAADLRELVGDFKAIIRSHTHHLFPEDPRDQLWGAIGAVFGSWDNERAVAYRAMNHIPGHWGTAVNVMAMVFGNMGESSGTGVAFTRDPATGEKTFYGEYLMNAQGEDVVAGIRTPLRIESLRKAEPGPYRELNRIQKLLEAHYRDMQDLEFTIEDGRLFMLQCRAGKRTGFAAVRIAVDMVREGLISKEEALMRVDPEALNQLLQPVFDPAQLTAATREGKLLTRGLNAGPGAACGRVVFSATAATEWAAKGRQVILVRIETSPEDIKGMQAARGILTARGGMTSHAALVARQMGKVCVAGAGELDIDHARRRMRVGGRTISEGDWISIDGTSGAIYDGQLETRDAEVITALFGKRRAAAAKRKGRVFRTYSRLMRWADEARTMKVRTNADQPDQCETALALGCEGIGLCRTEHMFFGEKKITAVRQMILAESTEERERALKRLLPLQRRDFEGIFRVMGTRPVTIRTLDPPLHEFLPHEPAEIRALAKELGVKTARLTAKIESLTELNPMLGHRGCRLGIVYPEITRTQARALFEAAVKVARKTRRKPRPEVMIPLVGTRKELALQAEIVRETAEEVFARKKTRVPYLVGTMIELPRAALTADEIALDAEFLSFGTNDLTQTAFGISRDDSGKFVPAYVEREVFSDDPFATLDTVGVGRLMEIACAGGRETRADLKIGICGEHGGDPRSIEFCQELGLDYVSCSPYRLPIARLAAAQAALRRRAGA